MNAVRNATDHLTDHLYPQATDHFSDHPGHTPSEQDGPVHGPVRTTNPRMYGPVSISRDGPVQRHPNIHTPRNGHQ